MTVLAKRISKYSKYAPTPASVLQGNIYTLTMNGKFENFATVRIVGFVLVGHNVRYRDLLYKVVDIDGRDLTVML